MAIGFKKINSENYPISDLYLLKINDEEIVDQLKKRNPSNFKLEMLHTYKTNLTLKLPLSVHVSRDTEKSKEEIRIENVFDFEGEEISKKFFQLDYQTLNGNNEYWLDNCEFILNIRTI